MYSGLFDSYTCMIADDLNGVRRNFSCKFFHL